MQFAKSKKPVLLIDGSNRLYSSCSVAPNLTAPDGRPSGGLFGVAKELTKLLINYPPSAVVFFKDGGAPQFRKDLVAKWAEEGDGYKEQRKKKKDPKSEAIFEAYKAQMDYAHEILSPLGVHICQRRHFEADDLIGSAVLSNPDQTFVVVSGDKDFAQLRLWAKNVIVYDAKNYEERPKPPNNFMLMRAVAGDSSDNIPGVRGIGEDTFYKIAEQAGLSKIKFPNKFFRLYEKWVRTLPKPGKRITDLLEQKEKVKDYFKAIDLRETASSISEAEWIYGQLSVKAARMTYKKFGFKSLLPDFDRTSKLFLEVG